MKLRNINRYWTSIIEWFAFEVEEHLAGKDLHRVATTLQPSCPAWARTEMDQGFRNSRGFRSPNQTLHQRIKNAYQLQLRGKTLFQVLVRFLSAANRRPKHSTSGLYEFAVKMTSPQPLMDRLIGEIEQRYCGAQTPSS